MPEWFLLGATTMASRTSVAGASSIHRATFRASTSRPGAPIPSSLVMRIRIRRYHSGRTLHIGDERENRLMLPSGEQIAIAHGEERAVITEVGATLRTFVKGGLSVIEGFAGEEVPTGARGQVLYPWP